MESDEPGKKKRTSQKHLKQDTSAYLRQREKANARKRKFLDKMTAEQKEIKKAKDRAYHHKKKAEKKIKKITDLTEGEKRKKRKNWKNASKRYREKKKASASTASSTPPHSEDDVIIVPLVRRLLVRKIVQKERAKPHSKIKNTGRNHSSNET